MLRVRQGYPTLFFIEAGQKAGPCDANRNWKNGSQTWHVFRENDDQTYNVGPPSYKMVYKPYEYYSYRL